MHDNKENKCDLVALLQKDIGKEIQKKVKGIHTNIYLSIFIFHSYY